MNNGVGGGKQAADKLAAELKVYLETLKLNLENTDIVVRIYADFANLAKACVKDGKIENGANLSRFANGFTQRQALFDFVDVGAGKVDHKIRGTSRILFF